MVLILARNGDQLLNVPALHMHPGSFLPQAFGSPRTFSHRQRDALDFPDSGGAESGLLGLFLQSRNEILH